MELGSQLQKSVTIRTGDDVIDHVKQRAEDADLPWQSLINLYLRDCAHQQGKVDIQRQPWYQVKAAEGSAAAASRQGQEISGLAEHGQY
jgi:hypothetical protein